MLKNTRDTYGVVSKFFHWSVALMVMGLILLGYYLDELSYSANQFTLIKLHKSFGLLVLWLAAIRIIWNLSSKRPKSLESHSKWEKILAKIIHVFLYCAIIGMPLSGWMMSMSGGYPVAFFGMDMPPIIDENANLNKIAWQAHKILSYVLVGGIALHAIGAFKHHIIDKDNTLKRMVFSPRKFFVTMAFITFLIFIGGLIRVLLF